MDKLLNIILEFNKFIKTNDIINANKKSIELLNILKTNNDYICDILDYINNNNTIENNLKLYIKHIYEILLIKNEIINVNLCFKNIMNNINLNYIINLLDLINLSFKDKVMSKFIYELYTTIISNLQIYKNKISLYSTIYDKDLINLKLDDEIIIDGFIKQSININNQDKIILQLCYPENIKFINIDNNILTYPNLKFKVINKSLIDKNRVLIKLQYINHMNVYKDNNKNNNNTNDNIYIKIDNNFDNKFIKLLIYIENSNLDNDIKYLFFSNLYKYYYNTFVNMPLLVQ